MCLKVGGAPTPPAPHALLAAYACFIILFGPKVFGIVIKIMYVSETIKTWMKGKVSTDLFDMHGAV